MNGEVERQNRSILKRLRIAQELGKDWRKELRQYLLMYHAANHTTTGKPPSELMFGRRIRTKLPCISKASEQYDIVRERDAIEKERGRLYADKKRGAKESGLQVGDRVLAKRTRKENKLCADFSPEIFDVVHRSGADVTIRSTTTGKEFRRSSAHLKALPREEPNGTDPIEDATSSEPNMALKSNHRKEEDGDPTSTSGRINRAGTSRRTRVEPKHLKDYVTY